MLLIIKLMSFYGLLFVSERLTQNISIYKNIFSGATYKFNIYLYICNISEKEDTS